LLSPAKALLVIARPKSPRLTASGKEAFRDRNRKIGANTRRAVRVMLLPSLRNLASSMSYEVLGIVGAVDVG
jgi:hypothetical protein